MSKKYFKTGRVKQKLETRGKILKSAKELVKQGTKFIF